MDTREQWLRKAGELICDQLLYRHHNQPLAPWRVSCGWPSVRALSAHHQRLGECWSAKLSSDGITHNIFITPALADVGKVLATLIHELVHVAVGTKAKHGKAFKQLARVVGLEGKLTATHAGTELSEKLSLIANALGPYPHSELNGRNEPKQGTRLLKLECPNCGYTVRTTRKWVNYGLPTCCCKTRLKAV